MAKKHALKTMFIYGKNSIKERLLRQPDTIRKIALRDNFSDADIVALIKKTGCPFVYKSEKELRNTKRADRLQGIVAEIDPFTYTPIEAFLDRTDAEKPLLLFLDKLNDPHNLGSILRICACFGNIVVCIPAYQSCEVNETVLHVCSGAENTVPVAKVTNLSNILKTVKKKGYWIAGTTVSGGMPLHTASLPFPLGLIVGSEGKGMSPGLERWVDMRLSIPMQGAALSFNVAMATAIFCYEIDKQRQPDFS